MAELEGLAAWRKARGRVGIQELPDAIPGAPFTLMVDFSGLSALVGTGQVSNPLLETALAGLAKAQADYATYEAAETPAQHLLTVQLELEKSLAAYHDLWLGAFIVAPPYYHLDQLPRGACPEDGICLYDIPPDRRQPLVDLARGGYESLDTFRAVTREQDAMGDGGEAASETEQLAAAPEPAGGVPPGPSPLRAVGAGGNGATSEAGPGPADRSSRGQRRAG